MKENDVYKWWYNNKQKDTFMMYHCKEGLAVVKKDKDGKLYLADTYWGVGDNSGAVFYPDSPKISMEYYTNLDEIELSGNDANRYYNKTDVFVLTSQHSCYNSCVYKYIRKGAKRDKKVMEKYIKDSITELESGIRYKLSAIENKKELLTKLDENYQTMYM